MRLRYSSLLAGAALTLAVGAAQAQTNYVATLAPCNEVVTGANPNPCGVSNGTGSGFFVLNAAETELSYNITYSGLTSSVSASHFHAPGNTAQNAGVVRGFSPFASPIIGTWLSTDAQPFTPTRVQNLKDGLIYANVHTSNYPAGEIRGNLVPATTATISNSWGRVKKLYR